MPPSLMMPWDGLLFAALLTAHLLADFVLQSDRSIAAKHRPRYFLGHIAIVTGLSYLFAGVWSAWWIPVGIGVTHALIDALKLRLRGTSPAAFWADQMAHLVVIVVATWFGSRVSPVGPSLWVELFGAKVMAHALVGASGLLAVVWMGGIVVGIAVRPYLVAVEHATARAAASLPVAPVTPADRGLLHGGRLIGQLERGLIFFFVVIGEPTAVAFLVAAKSVFRFGELKDRQNRVEAEYILIGTLMSFSWALVLTWITAALLAAI